MPARPHDPTKPTVYLDWSTFAYAVDSSQPGWQSYRFDGLRDWIERAARDANLCLAVAHVAELSQRNDRMQALRFAQWLDRLPIVWTRFSSNVEVEEDDYWVLRCMGIDAPRPCPFAPSLIRIFERVTPKAVAAMLPLCTVPGMLETEWQRGTGTERALGIEHLRMFNDDRAQYRDYSDKWKRETIAYRERVDLRQRAYDSDVRLRLSCPEYTRCGLDLNVITDPFVDSILSDECAHPMWHTQRAYNAGFAEAAGNCRLGKDWMKRAASSPHDYMHMVTGATFCDVFTCDQKTSEWLGGSRERRGLPRQIAFANGDTSAFMRQLDSTLQAARAAKRIQS